MMYRVVTKTSQKLCVRKSPSLKSPIIGYLYKDKIYEVKEFNEEWGYAESDDTEKMGYVSMYYLERVYNSDPDKIPVFFTKAEIKDMIAYLNKLLEGG